MQYDPESGSSGYNLTDESREAERIRKEEARKKAEAERIAAAEAEAARIAAAKAGQTESEYAAAQAKKDAELKAQANITLAKIDAQKQNASQPTGTGVYGASNPVAGAIASGIKAETLGNITAGEDFAKKYFTPGSMGRVNADLGANASKAVGYFNPDIKSATDQDIVNLRKDQLLGYDSKTMNALREQAQHEIERNTQTSLGQLRSQLGASGVQGGASLGKQTGLLQNEIGQKTNLEQNLLIDQMNRRSNDISALENTYNGNADFKQRTAKSFADELARQREETLIREQYNNGQKNRETFGGLGVGLQYANLLNGSLAQGEATAQANRGLDIAEKNGTAITNLSTQPSSQPGNIIVPGKVICTELFKQGMLSASVFEGDVMYARKFISDETIAGYHLWAKPIALLMAKSFLVTCIVRPFATAWAEEMAFRMGKYPTSNIFGRFEIYFLKPICTVLGKILKVFKGV